jgi:serine protease AprX
MIYKTILIAVLFTVTLLPQEKHFIYFKDKGINPGSTLNKSSQLFQQAVDELSERAIERRIKNMGDEFITYEDLPLSDNYLTVIKDLGIEIIHELKWFNSVSVRMNDSQIEQVKSLSFVDKVVPLKVLHSKNRLLMILICISIVQSTIMDLHLHN